MAQLRTVTIDRRSRNGAYSDILDAAQVLAGGDYGSATNAIAVMVRQSPHYHSAISQLNRSDEQDQIARPPPPGPGPASA